jgi:hypothetical protein
LSNLNIINNLKKRNFSKDIKQKILPILEKNAEKIVFIREMQGLRDVLYFEEKNLEFYDFPVFVSLNAETRVATASGESDLYGNYAEIYNNAITDTREIVKQIEDFFSSTKRTLFIEIGFQENELSNDEMWEVFHTMTVNKAKEPFQIMSSMYKYPEWYIVQNTNTFALIEDSIFYLNKLEEHFINEEINSLNKSIDLFLSDGDFISIQNTKNQIKILQIQKEKAPF